MHVHTEISTLALFLKVKGQMFRVMDCFVICPVISVLRYQISLDTVIPCSKYGALGI